MSSLVTTDVAKSVTAHEVINTIIGSYLDHVHTVENKPVTIHSKLERELSVNLREVLAIYRRGIRLIFPDIEGIQRKMEEELKE